MLRQSYRQLPPEHCAPHSMMWPAMIPAASRSQSSARPAELVAQRRHRQRGVGRAAGDDDVRAARERLDDRRGADVRVGRQHAVAHGRRAARPCPCWRARCPLAISSSRRGSRSSPVTTPICSLPAAPRWRATSSTACAQATGFTPPALAMTRTPRSTHGRQHALHRADEVARVAHRRIALLLLLQDRHRDLGEVVEHQVVDRPALDLAARRVEPVAPEALARCDANDAILRCGAAHASGMRRKDEGSEMRAGVRSARRAARARARRACPRDR